MRGGVDFNWVLDDSPNDLFCPMLTPFFFVFAHFVVSVSLLWINTPTKVTNMSKFGYIVSVGEYCIHWLEFRLTSPHHPSAKEDLDMGD